MQVDVELGAGPINGMAASLIAAARGALQARRRQRRLAQSDDGIEVHVEQTSAVSVVSGLSDAEMAANLQAALCTRSATTELSCSATGSGNLYTLSRTLLGTVNLTTPTVDGNVLSPSTTQINVSVTSTVIVVVRMPPLDHLSPWATLGFSVLVLHALPVPCALFISLLPHAQTFYCVGRWRCEDSKAVLPVGLRRPLRFPFH